MATPPVKKKYSKLDPQNKVNVGLEQLYPAPDEKTPTRITLEYGDHPVARLVLSSLQQTASSPFPAWAQTKNGRGSTRRCTG
jgi:hypothetical protein